MNKFRFESLLKLRKAERDEKKRAFLEAETLRLQVQAEIASLVQELEICQINTRIIRGTTIPLHLGELRRHQSNRNRINKMIQSAKNRLTVITNETETKRIELENALKEVRILQSLKEKTLEQQKEEERRRLNKTQDELTSQQMNLERRRDAKDADCF